jgi:hypothetical protein
MDDACAFPMSKADVPSTDSSSAAQQRRTIRAFIGSPCGHVQILPFYVCGDNPAQPAASISICNPPEIATRGYAQLIHWRSQCQPAHLGGARRFETRRTAPALNQRSCACEPHVPPRVYLILARQSCFTRPQRLLGLIILSLIRAWAWPQHFCSRPSVCPLLPKEPKRCVKRNHRRQPLLRDQR